MTFFSFALFIFPLLFQSAELLSQKHNIDVHFFFSFCLVFTYSSSFHPKYILKLKGNNVCLPLVVASNSHLFAFFWKPSRQTHCRLFSKVHLLSSTSLSVGELKNMNRRVNYKIQTKTTLFQPWKL